MNPVSADEAKDLFAGWQIVNRSNYHAILRRPIEDEAGTIVGYLVRHIEYNLEGDVAGAGICYVPVPNWILDTQS